MARPLIFVRPKSNIEKITNKNNVSDVLRDQMSPKKGGIHPRIIPHPSHLPESHFFNPHNSFMYGFLNFRFFSFSAYWTPIGPLLDPFGPHGARAAAIVVAPQYDNTWMFVGFVFWVSNRGPIGVQSAEKLKNRKFKKPYIKELWG